MQDFEAAVNACFKAYDIRGAVPDPLSPEICYALGQALVDEFQASTVALGRDVRLSGPLLREALALGMMSRGTEVDDYGICGTEEIYFSVMHDSVYDLGVMITGSHNPKDENGIKIIRKGCIPVSSDSGLLSLRERVKQLLPDTPPFVKSKETLHLHPIILRRDYVAWLLNMTNQDEMTKYKPLKIVGNLGNGAAGCLLAELCLKLPYRIYFVNNHPDGNFPNGVPNPLLPESRSTTVKGMKKYKANFGVAWDGDFDRCFFFDEKGNFIEGYYIVGLIAEEMLRNHPGEKIVHDPRLYWNTQDIVQKMGGVAIMSKTGHSFMKERMRAENAIYGGEMSAHHYFRDFAFCDSGILPFFYVSHLVRKSGKSMSEVVAERIKLFPCSGEINRRVEDPDAIISLVHKKYKADACKEDSIDGINLEFEKWRFNLRKSNTEPLLRLNVETRGEKQLLDDKTGELLNLIDNPK